jgi:hypothetical protein
MSKEKDEATLMSDAMNAHLDGVKEFLKLAFAIDGEVKTDGKQVLTIEQNGSKYTGISFTLTDSERGEFKIVMSNPEPIKDGK